MIPPSKIAICGSHSCGKTTLVRSLNKELNYPCIEEIAATYPKHTRLNMHTQYDIMCAQIRAELAYTDNWGKFLSDRSVIDNIAYSTLVQTQLVNRDIYADSYIYKRCTDMAFYHLRSDPKPYDLLIFINEILPYKAAPHRNFSTYNDQKFIWEMIENMFNVFAKHPIEMNTCDDGFSLFDIPVLVIYGNTEERVEKILKYIQ